MLSVLNVHSAAFAHDYNRAEEELSAAFDEDDDPAHWAEAGQLAKRRAAEVAIAIDGLADRAASELGLTPDDVRSQIASLCVINGTARPGSIERVCAVANAYKHAGPLRAKHPINSESDVLARAQVMGLTRLASGSLAVSKS